MKLTARPWRPQDLLDDLQEIVTDAPCASQERVSTEGRRQHDL